MIKKIKELIVEYFSYLGYATICGIIIYGGMALITNLLERRRKL